ncbi:hypothetical protein [Aurantimonas coralicida]|uniref:hypothetical protein n=1 Tax=Aurantimonas coralicida TaxID=182270 RepID=UPI001E4769A2|nr:hypothetical protein [Aurantimonas coralicida]MCD1642596.1 hypothetical protein [Aurantimonas coralicida]
MFMHHSSTPNSSIQQAPDKRPLQHQASFLPAPPTADATDREDTALLVGLSLWTARQHERYVSRTIDQAVDHPPHSYPAVLVETLSRHADAEDPTCRLVLDWLGRKGLIAGNAELALHGGTV